LRSSILRIYGGSKPTTIPGMPYKLPGIETVYSVTRKKQVPGEGVSRNSQ